MKRTWKENKNWKTTRSQETSIDEEHLGDKQTREEIVHKILAKQTNKPVPVVRRVDNALHRINLYPVDSAVSFVNTIRWIALSALYTTGPRINREGARFLRNRQENYGGNSAWDSCVTDKRTTEETLREILA